VTATQAAVESATNPLLSRALDLLGDRAIAHHSQFGDGTVVVDRKDLRSACQALRDDPELRLDFISDLTAVDYLGEEPRFEVVVHLWSVEHPERRLRVKCRVPEDDPTCPSLVPLWDGAEWMEREVFDLYGVHFTDHPDLRRVLLYEQFQGYPLRKDYDKDLQQPLFEPRYFGEREHLESSHQDQDWSGALNLNPVEPLAIGRSEVAEFSEFGPRPDGRYKIRHHWDGWKAGELDNTMVVSMGPSHPFTHGTIRFVLELDGETVVGVDQHAGYLHRGFEKEAEHHTYQQIIPYTDRLNYCSPMINNFAFCEAVEKMLGIEVPRRAQYLRVIHAEISRITDHLTCVGASLMELGAMTPFLYLMEGRDVLWELQAHVSGARLTQSYGRIGGVLRDIDADWIRNCHQLIDEHVIPLIRDTHVLIDKNRIFIDRMRGVGVLPAAEALQSSYTGPLLRASGVRRDVREYAPYGAYREFVGEWKVPIGKYGDNYDRYFVRMREIEESVRLVRMAIEGLPEGPVLVEDHGVALPPKREVYSNIEALIAHFKLVFEGVRPPVGEVYHFVEGANGELGFYIVSDGTGVPHKCRVRPPSFIHMGGVHKMMLGQQLADLVPIFGNVNMIGGECDR
jgi:NADH/F420H2 dehydrogenase subunit C